ncbi:LysR substrate-binding domain-containing protein [Achromobacter xylosoxidans]|uniref:LysR substrate-binding domain-containing protein n=1 Tax=Alcaligenes xylosoxydans xylosoxydans TaxID=85698 RepID=UPI001F05137E|nr:LysR substrate-binding domain-containing protein [Achromobacter xylosoxidans]MCH1988590.1 LysR substrate-binding domain-containing protein [Achromobacter xylosoxidans]MCH4586710.1 LysR substrate-binding domain-containing protein [Achromobacter xylosoxidans]
MRFDLTDLALFLHVVQAGSITHGAARANLALAAASARIRNLEASLGTPLLERRRQGVIPTPAGLKLAAHARVMLAQADRLRDDLADFSGEFGGSVHLLSNTNALTAFLPEALGGFLAAHPRINVELQEMLSDEIVECIADGSADIGIVAGTVDTGALQTYPYHCDRFVLIVPAGHALAGAAEIAFRDVLDEDFVGLDRSSALQRFLARQALVAGGPIKLRVQLRSFDAMCRLVEAGVGVGIVPETTANSMCRLLDVVSVALTDAWASRELLLCVQARETLSARARRLLDHLLADAARITPPNTDPS